MFELLQEYGPRMLNGLGITFQIVLTSVFAGAILSMSILMLRMSGSSILKSVSLAYIYFFPWHTATGPDIFGLLRRRSVQA